jgi:hypothetical protein
MHARVPRRETDWFRLAFAALLLSTLALGATGDRGAAVRGGLCLVGLMAGARAGIRPAKLAVAAAVLVVAVLATSDIVGDVVWVDVLAHGAGGALVAWATVGSRMRWLSDVQERFGLSRAQLALAAALAVGLVWEAGEWAAAFALPGADITVRDSIRDVVCDLVGGAGYLWWGRRRAR